MVINMSNQFFGIVEDINDPMKLGRIRVRIFGVHSPNKSILPTKNLNWSTVIVSNSAGVSGIGSSATQYVNGSLVYGNFLNDDKQHSIILGSAHSLPKSDINTQQGFHDPDGVYPKYINESDVNKLARGDKNHSMLKSKSILSNGSVIGENFQEPLTQYNSKYTFNKVNETTSGHVFEFDDTDGFERINLFHKDGSFIEFHQGGDVVYKTIKDKYDIVFNGNSYNYTQYKHLILAQSFSVETSSEQNFKASHTYFHNNVTTIGNSIVTETMKSKNAVVEQSISSKTANLGGVKIGSGTVTALSIVAPSISTPTGTPYLTKGKGVPSANPSEFLSTSMAGVSTASIVSGIGSAVSLKQVASTGNIDLSKAGTENSTYIYDVEGNEFKFVSTGSVGGSGGDLDGGIF